MCDYVASSLFLNLQSLLYVCSMKQQGFYVKAKVQIFPLQNPWVYVSVHKDYTEMFAGMMDRGLFPITVTLGNSTWNTSLLPKGDGTHFIPLNAKVRKKEDVKIGDTIELTFIPRNR